MILLAHSTQASMDCGIGCVKVGFKAPALSFPTVEVRLSNLLVSIVTSFFNLLYNQFPQVCVPLPPIILKAFICSPLTFAGGNGLEEAFPSGEGRKPIATK